MSGVTVNRDTVRRLASFCQRLPPGEDRDDLAALLARFDQLVEELVSARLKLSELGSSTVTPNERAQNLEQGITALVAFMGEPGKEFDRDTVRQVVWNLATPEARKRVDVRKNVSRGRGIL